MNFPSLSQNQSFNSDESYEYGGPLIDLNDSFNFRDSSIYQENSEFRNDLLNTISIDENNNTNNANYISNNINENEFLFNRPVIQVCTIINNKRNRQTIPSSKTKTKTSISKDNTLKMKGNDIVKRLGRKKKNEAYNGDIITDKVHTKKKPDNIRVKFKRLFFKNLIECLNDKLIKSNNPKLNSLSFKKLNSGFMKSIKKDGMIKMFNSPVYKVLSQKIAKKYKTFHQKSQSYYNKYLINLIYKEHEESLINILNKKTSELILDFCGITKDNILPEKYRLDDSIKGLSIDESKDYIEKFKNEAQKFEDTFEKIYGRRPKKYTINNINSK